MWMIRRLGKKVNIEVKTWRLALDIQRTVSVQQSVSRMGENQYKQMTTAREMYNDTLLCVGPYI